MGGFGWYGMGGVRRESGGRRLETADRRLEAGGSYGRIYASTQAAPGGTRYEIRDTRHAARRWAIVRNKANFGVCGLPMRGRAGIMLGLWEFGLEMDNPW